LGKAVYGIESLCCDDTHDNPGRYGLGFKPQDWRFSRVHRFIMAFFRPTGEWQKFPLFPIILAMDNGRMGYGSVAHIIDKLIVIQSKKAR